MISIKLECYTNAVCVEREREIERRESVRREIVCGGKERIERERERL